jgi:hypothetical protein
MARVTLFNSANGLSTTVDSGPGLRGKTWGDEASRWLREAVEPAALAGLGLGRVANFPSYLDGSKMGVRPLGEAYSTPNFSGIELSEVIQNSAVLATGDGADLTIGGDALTVADRTHANYYNTTTDPDDAVAPVGASAPAFLQTVADAGGINLAAVAGTIQIIVNGTTYTVNVGTATATTAEIIRTAVEASGAPVNCAIEGGDTCRIFTLNNGVTASISVVTSATALLLFTGAAQSSQVTTVYRGDNGPLGDVANADVVNGVKVQRRILPGSVTVTATVGAVGVTMTDNRAGVLVDPLGVDAGTINYVTGAITLTYAVAPDNATNVLASWKVLKPVAFGDEVRVPEDFPLEMAIRLL